MSVSPEKRDLEDPQILIKHKIPPKNQPWHKKWLSFYLQFCEKYDFDANDKNNVDPLLKEMNSRVFPLRFVELADIIDKL